MKVTGKSHSPENPEESFRLAIRFVSGKIEGAGCAKNSVLGEKTQLKTFSRRPLGPFPACCWFRILLRGVSLRIAFLII